MVRIVLGVIAGFVAWSILWIGTDAVSAIASPGWYRAHQDAFNLAMWTQQPFTADSTILLIRLISSFIFSIMAGFLAAFIAGENRKTPIALGILLFLFGLMVQISAWSYMPIWYHLIFLGLLIPMTIVGGKLKSASAP